jgi:LacI family transcriptional regulator
VRHLIEQGHRSIAMLAGPERHVYMQERVQGFTRALAEHRLAPVAVSYCSYQAEDAIQQVKALFAAYPRLTAIFVAAGDLVIGTMKACVDAGRLIPRDVSIIAFDDHPFFEHLTPAVTAVRQPVAEMGRIAVDILLALMEGKEPDVKVAVLPPTLMPRGSTCAPREP